MKLSGPSDEYTSDAKQSYRDSICMFADHSYASKREKASVFCLETPKMLEVATWVRRGYLPENITAVNRSGCFFTKLPYDVACRVLHNDAFSALDDMTSAGDRINIVNLDLCGPFTVEMGAKLARLRRDTIRPNCVVAVTVWRRSVEPYGTLQLNKKLNSEMLELAGCRSVAGKRLQDGKDAHRLVNLLSALYGNCDFAYTGCAHKNVLDDIERIAWDMYGHMLWIAVQYSGKLSSSP